MTQGGNLCSIIWDIHRNLQKLLLFMTNFINRTSKTGRAVLIHPRMPSLYQVVQSSVVKTKLYNLNSVIYNRYLPSVNNSIKIIVKLLMSYYF